MGFPCGSSGKESACNAGDLGSIPGSGRSPGEGNGNPLHTHNEILLSHKKDEFTLVLVRYLDPEPIIQNKVSQK